MVCIEAIFDNGCRRVSITIFHTGGQIIIICGLARKITPFFLRGHASDIGYSEKDEISIALIKKEINQKT